jgi:aspartate kinase
MLEMSASGAKVMALRSVEFARNYGVRLHVRSTFSDAQGTWIQEEDEQLLEKAIISGVTHDTSEAKVTIFGVPDEPGIAGRIFGALADADINVDMIIQNEPVSREQGAELSFTLPKDDLSVARRALEGLAAGLQLDEVVADEGIGTVSLIGAGMRSHPGVAAKVFETLGEQGINIEMISTSSIRISCVVRENDVVPAVRAIHDHFRLSEEAIVRETHPTAER